MPKRSTTDKRYLRNPLYKFKVRSRMKNRQIADVLGYRTVDGVVRLMRYANGPSLIVARRMALLIGMPLDVLLNDFAKQLERQNAR